MQLIVYFIIRRVVLLPRNNFNVTSYHAGLSKSWEKSELVFGGYNFDSYLLLWIPY